MWGEWVGCYCLPVIQRYVFLTDMLVCGYIGSPEMAVSSLWLDHARYLKSNIPHVLSCYLSVGAQSSWGRCDRVSTYCWLNCSSCGFSVLLVSGSLLKSSFSTYHCHAFGRNFNTGHGPSALLSCTGFMIRKVHVTVFHSFSVAIGAGKNERLDVLDK